MLRENIKCYCKCWASETKTFCNEFQGCCSDHIYQKRDRQQHTKNSKLDLPQPRRARSSVLRSYQKSVMLLISDLCCHHWRPRIFVGFGWALRWFLITWTLTFQSARRSGTLRRHFPRPTSHDLIEAESPAFDMGHNTQLHTSQSPVMCLKRLIFPSLNDGTHKLKEQRTWVTKWRKLNQCF